MSAIVAFYRGEQPDYLGRRLEEILSWNDVRLELIHNYIQVLFPLRESSLFNARAPLLDEQTIAVFRSDDQLRANLRRAFQRMLRFYGLQEDESGRVVRSDNFPMAAMNWVNPGNHNYLRITRILKSLRALGLGDQARAFFECLSDICTELGHEIGDVTLAYWKDAVGVEPLPERYR